MGGQQTITMNTVETNQQKAQNNLVIWIDTNIDPAQEDFKNSLTQLRNTVSEINVCTELAQCIHALKEFNEGRVFVISSGALGERLVPEIHNIPRLDAIYIFCSNKTRHEQWTKRWPKVRGVFTAIEPICQSLKKTIRDCVYHDIPMSFIPKKAIESMENSNKQNLDPLPPSYIYSVIFKDIMLESIGNHSKQMNDLVTYCRARDIPEEDLNYFQSRYYDKSPIWWYTCEIFLHDMLNKALRTLDIDAMITMSFFMRRLHLQLEQMHQAQLTNFTKKFTVYRGQEFSEENLQKLCDTTGGLLSFNNFLSTSRKQEVAMKHIREIVKRNNDTIIVMFIITVDPSELSTSTTLYALIDKYSANSTEQEILFTMNTICQVIDVKFTGENSRLWEVQLTVIDNNNHQLGAVTKKMKNEIEGNGWHQMSKLMLQVGHFNQAEQIYNHLLINVVNEDQKGYIYNHLGWIKWNQGKYQEATMLYENVLKIKLKVVSIDDISLVTIYNNIALAYKDMGDYSKALAFYKKSRKIKEKVLSPNHPSLAISYSNIGQVYKTMGEYSKSLYYFQKCLVILQQVPLERRSYLFITYTNIGDVHRLMRNYQEALGFHQKALDIPENVQCNPRHYATTYLNFGETYTEIKDYSTALAYFEKSLKICEANLPKRHPDLAIIYHNLSKLYLSTQEYNIGLQYAQQALIMAHETLPPTHPHLLEYRETFEKFRSKV